MKPIYKQSGITLIEMMIAIALSLIILAGVMHIFLNNKQTYRTQEAFARVQENGRYAIHYLTQDIRMAGYVGCGGRVADVENIADFDDDGNPDVVANFAGNGIEGYESSQLPLAITDTVNLDGTEVRANTDVIRITGASPTGARLEGNLASDNANIQLDPATATGLFQPLDYLFISDCESADIFIANNVSVTGSGPAAILTITHPEDDNIGTKLSKAYQEDAEVYKFSATTYYIGTNAAGNPALFRKTIGNAAVCLPDCGINTSELIEGIDDMQILYGEDTNGDGNANTYLNAAAVVDFGRVVSVRITVSVQSTEDNIAVQVTAAGDKRLRRTFTTSIAIRNRVG